MGDDSSNTGLGEHDSRGSLARSTVLYTDQLSVNGPALSG
jgi:hypothetical protein